MSEPKDMILPMLREFRDENRALHAATQRELDAIRSRLESIERSQVSFKAALTADTLMTRLITGDFEQRIETLERRVADLQGGA